MVYKFFDKKSASLTDNFAKDGSVDEIKPTDQLTEKIHKPIIN